MSDMIVTNGPSAMIQMAVQQGADLEKLEKLLELQERWERNEAKKAYVAAMAKFKENPPDIEKDRLVDFSTQKGNTSYRHASLHNVTTKIGKALSAHGLSAAWRTEQTDGQVSVTCTITHQMGHSESTSLTAAPDTSGNKNSIQAIGSTVSYLERYTILALTGLSTRDMDDDASAAEVDYITEEQAVQLREMQEAANWPDALFLGRFMKVESIDKIRARDFKKAFEALKARLK